MGENARITEEQWAAAATAQRRHGVSDALAAKMMGCGATTVRTHRHQGGWAVRILPEGFMSAEMLRETGAADIASLDLFAEGGAQALDETALRRAHERLLALILTETAKVGLGALDPLSVKRLEVMSNMAKSFEKLLDMKARLSPAGGNAGGAAETALVLKEMDRRVDELAAVRAREIIDHHCPGGACGARAFADEVARGAADS